MAPNEAGYTHIHMCMHACMLMHTHMHQVVVMAFNEAGDVYVCMYACMHACTYLRTYGCVDVCTYVYMYACMYAYQVVVMAFNEAGHVGPGLLDETALAEICQPDSVSWALCGQVSCVSLVSCALALFLCVCVCVLVCVCEHVHSPLFLRLNTPPAEDVSVGCVLRADVCV